MAMLLTFGGARSAVRSGDALGEAAGWVFAREFAGTLYGQFLPVTALLRENQTPLQRQIIEVAPLYGYAREVSLFSAERSFAERRLPQEDPEADGEALPEEDPEAGTPDAEAELPGAAFYDLLQQENEAALRAQEEQEEQEETQESAFVPHTVPQNPIDLEAFRDYDTLVQNFYTVDANTMASSEQLDVEELLSYDMTLDRTSDGPQILIYHTHSQEAFADSIPGDESTSIVGVGDRLAQILTEQYGYQVLHHKGTYDVDSRDDAYSRALPDLEQLLEQNPSIQVVIDLHRDEMPEGTRLAMDLDGRPTARFMFFNGLSRTRRTGSISYLTNEYQEENLAFSFQMKLASERYYPGLARKIYLKGYRYNLHLRPRSLLIELGAQNNTVQEAMNACDPIAHILDMVLSGQP